MANSNKEVILVLNHRTSSLSKAPTQPISTPRVNTKVLPTASQERQAMDLPTPTLKLRATEA
jgi:hypothetical protein